MNICLLNDSFPPLIDGVANAVVNYAENLKKHNNNPIVVTPKYPDGDTDEKYNFPIGAQHESASERAAYSDLSHKI